MSNPLSRLPSGQSSVSQNAQNIMNPQLQSNQPHNKMNQFQTQLQANMTNLNNSSNLINIAGLGNNVNSSMAINNLINNSPSSNQVTTPQIQHQLIESFRLAVQAGLISADLLNTKLPQDVLSLLYQLFQTLNQYMNSTQKLNNLNKRRTQMSPQQYKIEAENLNAEILPSKENLIGLQSKINSAHMQLKQMQSNNGSSNSSPNNNNETTINSLASAAAVAGVPLSDLPLLKDLPSSGSQNQNAVQRSKLLDLLNDNNSNRSKLSNSLSSNSSNSSSQFSRQSSLQPQTHHSQQKQTQQVQSSNQNQNPLFYQANQWSNFKTNENISPFSGNGSENSIIDDRITPFVPGQIWAGHSQSSIEDDPNCTPGSVSKPLLTETIDPESILSNLHRGNQWSNGVSLGGISDLSNSILNNNLSNNNIHNIGMSSNNNRSSIGGNQQRSGAGSSWNNASSGNSYF